MKTAAVAAVAAAAAATSSRSITFVLKSTNMPALDNVHLRQRHGWEDGRNELRELDQELAGFGLVLGTREGRHRRGREGEGAGVDVYICS